MKSNTSVNKKVTESFDPRKSVQKARASRNNTKIWILNIGRKKIQWASKAERISQVRKGLPYQAIEVISKKADMPISSMLSLFDMAQTTYNKKKKANELLDKLEGELILVLSEVLEFGLMVFNGEEDKFHRWLKKPNLALGKVAPKTLFDSLTGAQEVHNALHRIEYGNLS